MKEWEDYSMLNFSKYPKLSKDIQESHRNYIDYVDVDSLRILVYGEGLVFPTGITEDTYSKVDELIRKGYPFLHDYKGEMALIAEYLKRYNDNNEAWTTEFLEDLKNHYEEIEKAKNLFSQMQENGLIGGKITIECFSKQKAPIVYETKDNTIVKILLTGFNKELYNGYLSWFVTKANSKDIMYKKIQSEYQAPMLKAYFEMIYNEGISAKFSSSNAIKRFFGELGYVVGAFQYNIHTDRFVDTLKKKRLEQSVIDKKEQQHVFREIRKKLVSRIQSICDTYKEQTGIDMEDKPVIDKLDSECTLREYILYNSISIDKVKSRDYISAIVRRDDRYLYSKDKLDALFQ